VNSPLLNNDGLLAQNVPAKAAPGTELQAPPSSSGPERNAGASSPLTSMLPMLLVVAAFLPILFLQSRRSKKEAQARASLKKGDRVMTNAGILGELVELDERVAKVKISPSVTVQFLATSVSPYADPDKAPAKVVKDAKPVVAEKK
jgi:preprotein translocase subunit YajC